MSETKKAVLVVILAIACLGALCAWVLPRQVTTAVWVLRGGLTGAVVIILGLTIWAFRRRDRVPDFLRRLPGPMFERTGVCFKIAPSAQDGVAYLNIAFQNRFSSSGDFRVVLSPQAQLFKPADSQSAGIDVIVECAGGVLGVIHAPVAVPAALQGKKIKYQITALTRYFEQGIMLRVRTGSDVCEADKSQLQGAIITAVALLTGHVHFFAHRTPRIKIAFPGPVSAVIPEGVEPTVEVLWLPGDAAELIGAELQRALARG